MRSVPAPTDAGDHADGDSRVVDFGPGGTDRRLSAVAAAVASLPIVVAAARAIAGDWLPVGDNAYFVLRARDVLTEHHPLLGTGSSASAAAGTGINHPGPLLFDVLAVPTRLFGAGPGIAVGVALINVAAVVGIVLVASRRGGSLLACAAAAITAALSWSMGSELLFEPWQPYVLLLPFLCFLVLGWSVSCGELASLPWAVGVGSFVLQTHLSYAVLVPAVAAWAVLGLVLVLRRATADNRSALRRRALRALAASGVVAVVCWAQPLAEQLAGEGPGNLGGLVASLDDTTSDRRGFVEAARVEASVIALPPWWLRPSFRDPFTFGGLARSNTTAVASLALVGGVLAWAWWSARRRRDLVSSRAAVTAGVALVGGLLSAKAAPASLGIPAHEFRWLWPLGAFTTFALVTTLVRRLSTAGTAAAPLVVSFVALSTLLAALNLPTSDQGAAADDRAMPAIRGLTRELGAVEGRGTLLLKLPWGINYYSIAVLADLQRRGVPFVVDDERLLRQIGASRRFDGQADAVLSLVIGESSETTPDGAERIALVRGLTPAEQAELSELEAEVGRHARRHGLTMTADAEHLLRVGLLEPPPREADGGGIDLEALVASRAFVMLVRGGHLVLDERWARRYERYANLWFEKDRETVGLFLRPFEALDE